MNRRDFIGRSFEYALLTQFLFRSSAQATSKEQPKQGDRYLIVGDTSFTQEANNRAPQSGRVADVSGFACVMNLTSGEVRRHAAPIWAHKFTQHPATVNHALGVAKWTPSAIVMNMQSGKIERSLRAEGMDQFIGHGIFDPAGTRAYISASSEKKGRGRIYVYDAKSWSLLNRFDVDGYIHELIWSRAGDIVFAAGAPGSDSFQTGIVGVVNPADGSRKKTFQTPACYHLVQFDDSHVALGGITSNVEARAGLLNIVSGEQKDIRTSPDFPAAGFAAEALSLCPISKDAFAITFCEVKKLAIWNVRTNRIQMIEFDENTAGVALELQEIFVTYGKQKPRLHRMVLNDLSKSGAVKSGTDIAFGNGRHLSVMTF